MLDDVSAGRKCREKGVFVVSRQGLNQRHGFRAHLTVLLEEGKKKEAVRGEGKLSEEGGNNARDERARHPTLLYVCIWNEVESLMPLLLVSRPSVPSKSPPCCAGKGRIRSSLLLCGLCFQRRPPPQQAPPCTTDHGELCMAAYRVGQSRYGNPLREEVGT